MYYERVLVTYYLLLVNYFLCQSMRVEELLHFVFVALRNGDVFIAEHNAAAVNKACLAHLHNIGPMYA